MNSTTHQSDIDATISKQVSLLRLSLIFAIILLIQCLILLYQIIKYDSLNTFNIDHDVNKYSGSILISCLHYFLGFEYEYCMIILGFYICLWLPIMITFNSQDTFQNRQCYGAIFILSVICCNAMVELITMMNIFKV